MTTKSKGVSLPPLTWRPTPNVSSRHGWSITGVVVHETEGNYDGAVSWLRNPQAQASAHVVLSENGQECAQLVEWQRKAWHAMGANGSTLGLELAGFTAQANRREQLDRAARIVAWWCATFRVPPTIGRVVNGKVYGIVRHLDLGAFGGGHHDPGGFPWAPFVEQVAHEYRRGGFRSRWGRTGRA